MTKYSELTLITALAADDVIPVLDLSIPGTRGIEIEDLFQGIPVDVSIGIASGDGTLHVHTATAGAVTANTGGDEGIFENSGDSGISILTPAANAANIYFGSPTSTFRGGIRYDHATDILSLRTAQVVRLNLSDVHLASDLPLKLLERADDVADTATYGQLWVLNGDPNTLMYTDGDGTKFTVDVTAV